jgi:hypothetical protein
MISRLVTKGVVIGVAATFAIAAPASAAAKPTLSGPEEVVGYSQFTMTGTADPNTTVELWETAISINEMKPADDWEGGSGTVKATADASGKFTIKRWLDTGFFFEVHQGDQVSSKITVYSRLKVNFWVTNASTTTPGSLTFNGDALPAQPGLDVTIQRKSGSSWVTVTTAKTAGDTADFSKAVTGQPGGNQTYRAVFDGDPANGVRGTTSGEVTVWTPGGTTTTPPTTTPPTTKPPTTPPTTKPPTTPTKPPTTTPPPATGPAIAFTHIQYDPPGTDSGSNGSLLNEYFKITNMTKKAININGWTVRDGKGIVYRFPNINMNVGQSYLVRTGKGVDNGSFRHWGRAGKAGYVWDNLGDIAYLRNPAGGNVDICKWTKLGPGYTKC